MVEKEENYQVLDASELIPKKEEKQSDKVDDKREKVENSNDLVFNERRKEKRDFRKSSHFHIKSETLETKRVVKVTKGGRRFSFTSLVLVKDEEKKSVAFACAGGKEVVLAFRKSLRKAQKKLITYFSTPVRTIPRDEEVKYKSVTIKLWPAPPGTGVKAGSVLNKLFKFLEIKDVSAKIIASRRARKNKLNVIRAAFLALDKLTGKKYEY
jgi:small subunit ribosomal protein S5